MSIGIIIIIVALVLVSSRSLMSHFTCPKCGKDFKVGILKYIFAPHFMGKRQVTCPHCGHNEMLSPHFDKK